MTTVDFLLTEVLLLTISYVLLLKGLNLRRFTPLGRALAGNNLAFSFVYFCASLGWLVPFFKQDAWSYFVRLLILTTAIWVLREMAFAFGGWKVLHLRAWHSLIDMLRHRPQRTEENTEGY